MNYFAILTGLSLFSMNAAFAADPLYRGHSQWKRQGSIVEGSFNELEQLGVQRAAETDAISRCGGDGAQNCVIVSTGNTTCAMTVFGATSYMYTCDAAAVARGTK